MKDILVLLLTGGDSSRMWPLEDKHFQTFLGRYLIEYSLSQLSKYGLTNFIFIVNKNNKQQFEQIKSTRHNLKINIIEQTDFRGMAGAILSAKKYLKGKKILIIGPSDVYEDFLFMDFQKLLDTDPEAIIPGIIQNSYFPGGYLKIDNDNITGIIEKPKETDLPSNLITFVFDYFKNADNLIRILESTNTQKDDLFEKSLDRLINEGYTLKLLKYNGFFGYLKFPWHILKLNSFFLGKINGFKKMQNVDVHKSSIISGNVYLDKGVRILENAKIVGPCYIGEGTVIGNNAIVRESMIGKNCVVGFGTEIARSHIGNNCWFHSNYIGDSVVSDNVSMGAGTILANFRLDEAKIKSKVKSILIDSNMVKLGAIIGKNVRIGVNTSIMPGIKIGKATVIGAGIILDQDIEDRKFCYYSPSNYKIKNNNYLIPSGKRSTQRESLKLT